jgi:uncharacterized phage protein (TIGR01671 family)
MREFKFRAFYYKEKRMLDWEELRLDEMREVIYIFENKLSDVSPMMQYTGLKDKNGKEIYESDILSDGTVIEYGESSCGCCSIIHGYDLGLKNDPYYGLPEVIGNLYENPELLND